MPQRQISIAIIGGGIGGCSAALSLLHAGFDVHVYEQTHELREAGAGVQISPNASRILHKLGLAGALARLGVKPLAWQQRRWQDGRVLMRVPLADAMEAAYGAPYYHMHRADLLSAISAALPPERLHVSHRLTNLVDHGDRVEAEFENGARVDADVLVGADGIHSAVRRLLFGPEQPRFTGCIAYRGLVPAERLAHLDLEVTAQSWVGPGRHFVHYFVQARRLVNFVACIARDTWTRESWTDRGEVADALKAYDGWHPQIRAILGAVSETFIWALFDRAPLPAWSKGRVTLLGDACHPMLPFMAQGAAQAIEDGAALAACLMNFGPQDLPAALRRYESTRLPRTSRLQALSAANKTRFHLPDGPAQQARDAELERGAAGFSPEAVGWIYGHDAGVIRDAN